MNFTQALSLCVASLFLSASILTTSCTKTSNQEENAPIRLNVPLLQNYHSSEMTELWISQNDPTTQRHWTARLTRPGTKLDWTIASAPEGQELRDHLADSAFISHLLSLFETLQAIADAPQGPPTSFALEPPIMGLKMSGGGKTYGINFGMPAPKNSGSYAYLPGPPASRVIVANGSVLEMLNMVNQFDVLRRRTLSTLTSDEVDEVELWRGKKKLIYAQRQGDDWADSKQKKMRIPIQDVVEALTHLRIKSFVDDPGFAQSALARLRNPEYRAVLKDRNGTSMEIRLAHSQALLFGVVSSRPKGVFEMHADSTRFWNSTNFNGK